MKTLLATAFFALTATGIYVFCGKETFFIIFGSILLAAFWVAFCAGISMFFQK